MGSLGFTTKDTEGNREDESVKKESKDSSGDAVLQQVGVEVDEEAHGDFGEPHVGQKLVIREPAAPLTDFSSTMILPATSRSSAGRCGDRVR